MVKFVSDIRDTLEIQKEQDVGDNLSWGRNGQPQTVAWTEDHARSLVAAVADAVAQQQQSATLEQYKQVARLESDLVAARTESGRRQEEITALRAHIDKLQNVIASMVPPSGPIRTQVPTFPNRFAADHQVPDLDTTAYFPSAHEVRIE